MECHNTCGRAPVPPGRDHFMHGARRHRPPQRPGCAHDPGLEIAKYRGEPVRAKPDRVVESNTGLFVPAGRAHGRRGQGANRTGCGSDYNEASDAPNSRRRSAANSPGRRVRTWCMLTYATERVVASDDGCAGGRATRAAGYDIRCGRVAGRACCRWRWRASGGCHVAGVLRHPCARLRTVPIPGDRRRQRGRSDRRGTDGRAAVAGSSVRTWTVGGAGPPSAARPSAASLNVVRCSA